MTEIIVNTRKLEWNYQHIKYEEVVTLAGYRWDNEHLYTVTYSMVGEWKGDGSMIPNSIINVTPKMIFNVSDTGKA